MPDAQQIEQWKQDAKKEGPGLCAYPDIADPTPVWFQVDSRGRVRNLGSRDKGRGIADFFNPPHLKLPKFPAVYLYGYERGVADAHELLLNDLFYYPRWEMWHEEMFSLAGNLAIPDDPCPCYKCLVENCRRIEEKVATERPRLAAGLESMARRHGIDALPWGRGWLASWFCIKVETDRGPDEFHKPKGYPRTQRSPALDSLLLYMYLTGHFNDQRAREIVRPAIDLDLVEDPIRRIQEIKRQLGISREPGRPKARDDEQGAQEVYELLRSQVIYLTRRNGLQNS